MPSNLFTQQYVSETAPNGAVLGDEWFNSITGKLYKQTIASSMVAWVDISPLPSQSGNSGKYLTTDGANISWSTVSALPIQTGNSGKYLTTDGLNASWSTVSALPIQTGNSGKYLTTDGTTASWGTVAGGVTLSDDTSTTNTSYITMARATSGSASTVYISSTKLYFNPSNGTLTSTNFNTVSDINQKTNISTSSGLDIVKQLNGVEFDFIESGQHSSGVIAQELEKILPFLVTEFEGTKTVNYSGLIAYLINSVKELDRRVKELEG